MSHKWKNLKPSLFSFSLTIGGSILGGVMGLILGFVILPYILPLWDSEEINVEGQTFTEIAGVDFSFREDAYTFDTLYLKTAEGELFAYRQDEWQPTETLVYENPRFQDYNNPCAEWVRPPPVVFYRNIKDSQGIDFAHALASNSRCYLLLSDNTLQIWQRSVSVFDYMISTGLAIIVGLVLGVILGKFTAEKILWRRAKFEPDSLSEQ